MSVRIIALSAAALSIAGYQAAASPRSGSTGNAVMKTDDGELHLRSERGGGVRVVTSSFEGQDRLRTGDLILQLGNRRVATPEDFFQILRALDARATANAQVVREGKHIVMRLNASSIQGLLPPVPPRPPSPGK